ncbi:hypothetical protein MKEN_01467800 [Mycena kentingensis (nom. inval.)]|nr:hypothetical protein MKEN_01467800 [Mycena kentingensis (nom. inval.)]
MSSALDRSGRKSTTQRPAVFWSLLEHLYTKPYGLRRARHRWSRSDATPSTRCPSPRPPKRPSVPHSPLLYSPAPALNLGHGCPTIAPRASEVAGDEAARSLGPQPDSTQREDVLVGIVSSSSEPRRLHVALQCRRCRALLPLPSTR